MWPGQFSCWTQPRAGEDFGRWQERRQRGRQKPGCSAGSISRLPENALTSGPGCACLLLPTGFNPAFTACVQARRASLSCRALLPAPAAYWCGDVLGEITALLRSRFRSPLRAGRRLLLRASYQSFSRCGCPAHRAPGLCWEEGTAPQPADPPGRLFLYSASFRGPLLDLFLSLLSDALWTTLSSSALVLPDPARCGPCSPRVPPGPAQEGSAPRAAPPVPAGLRAGRRQCSPRAGHPASTRAYWAPCAGGGAARGRARGLPAIPRPYAGNY